MPEEISAEEIIKSLGDALAICRPDEYQQRHNLLIRQLVAYVLKKELAELEGEIE